ncbi:HigA family addiction module antitoxin [Sphingobacterium sp. UBA6645]|uniref:HigA family addiction module antitoxin n=1 Tax=Sphingobacterium sp. UBA6645 TaxID=1947511 RepID=UPI0025CDD82C|nr:HigA family addiction module antitoxin [Sphingobacterium sp. UBA6645]
MKQNPIVHPGLLLKEDILEFNNLSVTDAAKLLGITRINLSKIINEKSAISPNMAIRISKVFGGSPDFWLKLQMRYDLINAEKEFEKKNIQLEKYNKAS